MADPHKSRSIPVPFAGVDYRLRLDTEKIYDLEEMLPGGIQYVMVQAAHGTVPMYMRQMEKLVQAAIGEQVEATGKTVREVLESIPHPALALKDAVSPIIEALFIGLSPPKDSEHFASFQKYGQSDGEEDPAKKH